MGCWLGQPLGQAAPGAGRSRVEGCLEGRYRVHLSKILPQQVQCAVSISPICQLLDSQCEFCLKVWI